MKPRAWLSGLGFPEGPRWHRGRLWFSDFAQRVVRSAASDGSMTEVARVPARPSGLGWLPDGSLLVVSMDDRRLLRQVGDALVTHAELASFAEHPCNDMVVSAAGRAYVGHMGFDLHARPRQVQSASLLLVEPDGSARVAADELLFPNGAVLTADQRTLIVAETFGARLTAFDVRDDGSLGGRRVYAALPGRSPDGICLDREGALWVADAAGRACVRVREGGEVTDVIDTGRGCYACALGGNDGRTLFLCKADGFDRASAERNSAAIETVEVTVPA